MTLDANDVGDYVSIRGTLADRPGYQGSARLGGIEVVISPALPSTPTWMEDLVRYVRHKLVILEPAALRAFDPGPLPGDPTHAARFGNTMMVSADLFEQLKRQAR
jgi:hypothetical protein